MDRLTDEHIPPKAAFNKGTIRVPTGDFFDQLDPDVLGKGRLQQGGFRIPVLCRSCNNDTGAWYGTAYTEWANEGARHLLASGGQPRTVYIANAYPLRVLKQIVVMLLAINSPQVTKHFPELSRFVLNRRESGLPGHLRLFAYYNFSEILRGAPLTGLMLPPPNNRSIMTEVATFPFGYVLTVESGPPSEKMVEITRFSKYGYDSRVPLELDFAPLNISTILPGDYRTIEQVKSEAASAPARASKVIHMMSAERRANERAKSAEMIATLSRYGVEVKGMLAAPDMNMAVLDNAIRI